jgi:ABC-2 type transport system ATP-binding protein
MLAISIKNLVKTYDNKTNILAGLSLEVKEAEIFTLLGSNGAGKSTLINILNTSLNPNSGEISVFNHDITEKKEIRKLIACVSQNVSVYKHLTMKENFLFQSKMYHINRNDVEQKIQQLIEVFGLQKYTSGKVGIYSGGIQRRIDIAMSMISNPKILFLDEPTVGMDIVSRKALWDTIRQIKEAYKTTVFLTTHYLEEADILSDTICIMKDGKRIIQASPDTLRAYTENDLFKIELYDQSQADGLYSLLSNLPFVPSIHRDDSILSVYTTDQKVFLSTLYQLLNENQIIAKSVSLTTLSLDDIFLKIITEKKGA